MLRVSGLSSYYGAIQALRGVSLELGSGEAVAVLGPNGAGKSTLLRTISGLVRPRKGSITYKDQEISGRSPDAIVRMGVVHVPEGRRIFSQMTVMENLMMGAFSRRDGNGVKEDQEFVFSLFPDLYEKRRQFGGELSGGQQQMLAIGRAFMGRPSLLLLDEPSLGLSPLMIEQLSKLGTTMTDFRQRLGMSILLVDQNIGLALEMVSQIHVMQAGRIALSRTVEDVSVDEIREAYLGRASREKAAPAP